MFPKQCNAVVDYIIIAIAICAKSTVYIQRISFRLWITFLVPVLPHSTVAIAEVKVMPAMEKPLKGIVCLFF